MERKALYCFPCMTKHVGRESVLACMSGSGDAFSLHLLLEGPALWELILHPQERDQCNEMLIQVWPESVSFIVNNSSKQHCGEPANQDIIKKNRPMLNMVLPHWGKTVMIFCLCALCSCEMIKGMVHSNQIVYF